jgi:two-component system, LytTR family, response regulator
MAKTCERLGGVPDEAQYPHLTERHDLEAQLDPKKFVRIHRSIIVNLDRIKEMHPHFNGDYVVVLDDGSQLKLSRSRREHLEARLQRGFLA